MSFFLVKKTLQREESSSSADRVRKSLYNFFSCFLFYVICSLKEHIILVDVLFGFSDISYESLKFHMDNIELIFI